MSLNALVYFFSICFFLCFAGARLTSTPRDVVFLGTKCCGVLLFECSAPGSFVLKAASACWLRASCDPSLVRLRKCSSVRTGFQSELIDELLGEAASFPPSRFLVLVAQWSCVTRQLSVSSGM